MQSRTVLLLTLLLIANTAHADSGDAHHDRGRMLTTGSAAPAFGPLPVLNDKLAGATQLAFDGKPAKGERVWLVSFFATWCPGCVNEMPMLRKLNEDYRARGVRVVSVSVDRSPNADAQIKSLLDKNKIRHPVIVDSEGQVLRLFQGGSTSLPYIYVIGPDGVVAKVHEGFDASTEGVLRSAIDGLLSASVAQNK